jgi:probable HAF family extracellular repeat protein
MGGSSSYAYGINNEGQVVGYVFAVGSVHSFLYSAGSMTDLGTLNGFATYAQSINDAGQIVGYALPTSGADHAFLYLGRRHDRSRHAWWRR